MTENAQETEMVDSPKLTEAEQDRIRARLLVSVTKEDADFIERIVTENERLRENIREARVYAQRAHEVFQHAAHGGQLPSLILETLDA